MVLSSNDINSRSGICICLVRVWGGTIVVVTGSGIVDVIVDVDVDVVLVDCDGDVISGSVAVFVVDGGDIIVLFDPDIQVNINIFFSLHYI